ncbi:nitrous oxide reductase accessory protein NosL [Persephonella sp.]
MNSFKGGSFLFVIYLTVFILISCQKVEGPVPIEYGIDKCSYCSMTIMDDRYGSELVTEKGKVYKFDSVECLAGYYLKNKDKIKIKGMYVTDFVSKKLINIRDAYFLHSKNLPSPMGLNLSAFSSKDELEKVRSKYGGEILNWENILNLVEKKWLNKDHDHHHSMKH